MINKKITNLVNYADKTFTSLKSSLLDNECVEDLEPTELLDELLDTLQDLKDELIYG